MSNLLLSETVALGKLFVEEGAPALNSFMSGNQSSVLYDDSVASQTISAINLMKSKIPLSDTLGIKIMEWYITQFANYKDSSILAIKRNF